MSRFNGVTDNEIYKQLTVLNMLNEDGVKAAVDALDIESEISITPGNWMHRYNHGSKYAYLRELGCTSKITVAVRTREWKLGLYRALHFALRVMDRDGADRYSPKNILEHYVHNERPISLVLQFRKGSIDFDMALPETSLEDDVNILNALKYKIAGTNRSVSTFLDLRELGLDGIISVCDQTSSLKCMFKAKKKAVIEWIDVMIENTVKELNKTHK